MIDENDGRFPDESAVLVRYPLQPGPERQTGQSQDEHLAVLRTDRVTWPWLPGTIEQQCGPDEWLVTIEDRRLAELDDGSPAPEGTPDENLLFPQCYRDGSEIRSLPADSEPRGPEYVGWASAKAADPCGWATAEALDTQGGRDGTHYRDAAASGRYPGQVAPGVEIRRQGRSAEILAAHEQWMDTYAVGAAEAAPEGGQ
jgi:hypothetical protein